MCTPWRGLGSGSSLAAAGSFMHTPRRGLLRGRGAQARAPDSCCCGGFVVAQHTHRYTRAHHATHNSFLGHMQASRRRLAAAQEEKKRRPWSPSTNRECVDVPASKHDPIHLPAPPDRKQPTTAHHDDQQRRPEKYAKIFQGAHANLAHPHQMFDFEFCRFFRSFLHALDSFFGQCVTRILDSFVTHIWVNPYLD